MRVLVTGASGYLGSAIAQALVRHGHQVTGLVRDEIGRRTLAAAGIPAVLGDLDTPSTIATAAAGAEAIIEAASADNHTAARALLDIIAGTGRRYLRTSGVGVYSVFTAGDAAETSHTEDEDFTPHDFYAPRLESDQLTVAAAARGDHTVVLRPGMVYGNGASEQLPVLLRAALRTGTATYAGAGANQYGNVHIDDLATAYVLALERAPAGSIYNLAPAENSMREIAEGVAAVLGLPPATSVSIEEQVEILGPLYGIGMSVAARADSGKARVELGWTPQAPSLLDDLTQGSYRRVWGDRPPVRRPAGQ